MKKIKYTKEQLELINRKHVQLSIFKCKKWRKFKQLKNRYWRTKHESIRYIISISV